MRRGGFGGRPPGPREARKAAAAAERSRPASTLVLHAPLLPSRPAAKKYKFHKKFAYQKFKGWRPILTPHIAGAPPQPCDRSAAGCTRHCARHACLLLCDAGPPHHP